MCCPNDTDGGSPSSVLEDCDVVWKESLTLLSKWPWNSSCNPGWLVTQASFELKLSCLPRSPEAWFASFQRLFLKVYEQNKHPISRINTDGTPASLVFRRACWQMKPGFVLETGTLLEGVLKCSHFSKGQIYCLELSPSEAPQAALEVFLKAILLRWPPCKGVVYMSEFHSTEGVLFSYFI